MSVSPSIVAGFSEQTIKLVQEGLLERAFHDPLYPAQMYVGLAEQEEWPANTGTEIFMTRSGLLAPITTPLPAGQDPQPQEPPVEQWPAILNRYAGRTDCHMPTAAVSSVNEFVRRAKALGLQAGQSINRLPRNAIHKAYLSGHTTVTVAGLSADTSLQVASLNGFRDVLVRGTQVRPVPVSTATPLLITIAGVTGTRGVIGAFPADDNDPEGPGTLLLNAALGAGVSARAAVLSSARPLIIRAGGGTSIDAIGASDILTLQDFLAAKARLRRTNVMPFADGLYHAHIPTSATPQLFADPAFQSAARGQVNTELYRGGFIAAIAGIAFFENNEQPDSLNAGTRVSTGTSAYYSSDIGAETTNNSGYNIARSLIVGRGALYERSLDEKGYVSEAGTTGKVGDFQVTNQGVKIVTDGVTFILRAPINVMQDQVTMAWSKSTSFPVPSDITAGDASRYKRGLIIEAVDDQ